VFSDAVKTKMRRAIAQLRYELSGRRMQPGRGEKVFRVLAQLASLRDVEVGPGDLVALQPDDPHTIYLLHKGSIELFTEAELQTDKNTATVAA
jgi:hypothetical protein